MWSIVPAEVWVAGQGDTFTVNARVRIPTQQSVNYMPNGFQARRFTHTAAILLSHSNSRTRIPTLHSERFPTNVWPIPQVAKFGWIQFLSILAIFVPVVVWMDWVFFHFRVVPTRVVHDLQPKTHRF